MDYQIPAPTPDPKHRYIRVTDPDEIAACIRNDTLDCPDAENIGGEWFATWHSLQVYRKVPVEIEV
jgi:hypothetical protein